MVKYIRRMSLQVSAAVFVGMVGGVENAFAGTAGLTGGTGKNFSFISGKIGESISQLPGLLSGVAYMVGILLGVLGILKIKDHVENPGQTPIQHGAIRLVAGGGLFALPIVYEAMMNTIGGQDGGVTAAKLNAVDFTTK